MTGPPDRDRPAGGAGPAGARRVTAAAEETERLGEWLAAGLLEGDVLVLRGPLGSGKTRLVAGLARGLGVRSRVRSPSFTLLNEYRGVFTLHHLDLYRLEGSEAEGLGLEELADEGALVAEWGEKLPAWLRAEALTLDFEVLSEDRRAITASGAGERGSELLAVWELMPSGEAR